MSPHHSDHKPPALPVDKVLFGSVFQHKKLGSDKRRHTKHFTVSCTVKGLPPSLLRYKRHMMPMAGPGPQLLVSAIPPIAGGICTSILVYMY